MRHLIQKVPSLLAVVLVLGCAHTRIAPRTLAPEVLRLESLATRSVAIDFECAVDEIVGHQYLLLALPFGRISLAEVGKHLENSLTTELSKFGVIPFFVKSSEPAEFRLRCNRLSLTAYDLIFLRRIVGDISLQLIVKQHPELPLSIEASESEFRAFAFHEQLERSVQLLLSKASREIGERIRAFRK